jgi:hypothetical protein
MSKCLQTINGIDKKVTMKEALDARRKRKIMDKG